MGYYRDTQLAFKQISFPLNMDKYSIVREMAQESGLTIAGFMRVIVDTAIETYHPAKPSPERQFSSPRPAPDPNEFRERLDANIKGQSERFSTKLSDDDLAFFAGKGMPIEEQNEINASLVQGRLSRLKPTSTSKPSDIRASLALAQSPKPKEAPTSRPPHKRSDVI